MKKRKLFCFFRPTYKNTHRNSLFAHCMRTFIIISFLYNLALPSMRCYANKSEEMLLYFFSAVKLDSHEDCCRKSHPIDIESKSWIGNPSHPTGCNVARLGRQSNQLPSFFFFKAQAKMVLRSSACCLLWKNDDNVPVPAARSVYAY